MRGYIDRVASAIHREQHRRAAAVPRALRPRRSRSTFVPVRRDVAYAY